MILKIEHLGFAVADAGKSVQIFEKLLNVKSSKTEEVASEKVRTWFFQSGESQIELLESTDPDGVISRFLQRRGEGMHHIAFLTDNLDAEIIRLRKEGFEFINPEPKMGADNKRIIFLHPSCTGGVLVELCEEVKKL